MRITSGYWFCVVLVYEYIIILLSSVYQARSSYNSILTDTNCRRYNYSFLYWHKYRPISRYPYNYNKQIWFDRTPQFCCIHDYTMPQESRYIQHHLPRLLADPDVDSNIWSSEEDNDVPPRAPHSFWVGHSRWMLVVHPYKNRTTYYNRSFCTYNLTMDIYTMRLV